MKIRSFTALGLPLLAGALALSACGKSDEKKAPSAATPVAGKAAPAGTAWSDQVVETPEGGYRMGNPDAPLKLIEYASYTCSHCADFAQHGEPALVKDYVDTGKVSYEFRNYVRDPLDLSIALLARCSGKDAFFPLSNQFFANQMAMFGVLQQKGEAAQQSAMSAPPPGRFLQLAQLGGVVDFAKQRGVAEDKAKTCLADMKTAQLLADGVEKANATYSIQGTPSFILNGTLLEDTASWDALSKRLKDAGA
jgi:protein-disulfide isomerase